LRLEGNELMTFPSGFFLDEEFSMYLCKTPTHSHSKSTMSSLPSPIGISSLDVFG